MQELMRRASGAVCGRRIGGHGVGRHGMCRLGVSRHWVGRHSSLAWAAIHRVRVRDGGCFRGSVGDGPSARQQANAILGTSYVHQLPLEGSTDALPAPLLAVADWRRAIVTGLDVELDVDPVTADSILDVAGHAVLLSALLSCETSVLLGTDDVGGHGIDGGTLSAVLLRADDVGGLVVARARDGDMFDGDGSGGGGNDGDGGADDGSRDVAVPVVSGNGQDGRGNEWTHSTGAARTAGSSSSSSRPVTDGRDNIAESVCDSEEGRKKRTSAERTSGRDAMGRRQERVCTRRSKGKGVLLSKRKEKRVRTRRRRRGWMERGGGRRKEEEEEEGFCRTADRLA